MGWARFDEVGWNGVGKREKAAGLAEGIAGRARQGRESRKKNGWVGVGA